MPSSVRSCISRPGPTNPPASPSSSTLVPRRNSRRFAGGARRGDRARAIGCLNSGSRPPNRLRAATGRLLRVPCLGQWRDDVSMCESSDHGGGHGHGNQVTAAMPRQIEGEAIDPIALEPVDELTITSLVDNSYDGLTATWDQHGGRDGPDVTGRRPAVRAGRDGAGPGRRAWLRSARHHTARERDPHPAVRHRCVPEWPGGQSRTAGHRQRRHRSGGAEPRPLRPRRWLSGVGSAATPTGSADHTPPAACGPDAASPSLDDPSGNSRS